MEQRALLFSNWLDDLAEHFGDNPALICENTLSFSDLRAASRRFAMALAGAGVQKGDKVILWAVNGVDWMVAFFAVTMAGGTASLVNYGLSSAEVTQLTDMVGAKWALVGRNRVSVTDPQAAEQALIEGGVPADHILALSDLFRTALDDSVSVDDALLGRIAKQIAPRDTQCIIFTTGTTSLPKAVQLSSYSLLSNVMASSEIDPEHRLLSTCIALPLFHNYGLVSTLSRIISGAPVYLVKDFNPEAIMDLIAVNKIELLITVGAVCITMSRMPDFGKKLGNVLKGIITGGGFTNPAELIDIENKLQDCTVLMGYGQTEYTSVISCNVYTDSAEVRTVTAGRIIPHTQARIWSKESGFLGPGQIGELLVKGPCVMNGYLGLPEEEQPFDADGWLHTGDLALITEDGLLVLKGRVKDIIVRKGENISPEEIEMALLEEPCIREARVFGVPHPVWGESVEACVVLSGDLPDETALRSSLTARLAAFKIPSHFLVFSSFPLSSNGKLDERTLRELMLKKLQDISEDSPN